MKKNNSGITLIVLIITIIVLIIIVSITVFEGKKLIARSRVQTLETNMLTIQAKAKAYAEEIDAKIWTEDNKDSARDREFSAKNIIPTNIEPKVLGQVSQEIKGNPSDSDNYVAYEVTGMALVNMGLKDLEDEKYVVIYSKSNYKLMDIIYPKGISYKKSMHYTLSNLQSILVD